MIEKHLTSLLTDATLSKGLKYSDYVNYTLADMKNQWPTEHSYSSNVPIEAKTTEIWLTEACTELLNSSAQVILIKLHLTLQVVFRDLYDHPCHL